VTDLAPMKRCRVDRKGRHHLSFVVPENSEGYITAACDMCGAMRRVPASGDLVARLDDIDVDALERELYGSKR
jgi:hypothetical protein